MGARLIGNGVNRYSTSVNLRKYLGAITNQSYRDRTFLVARIFDYLQGIVQVQGQPITVSCSHSPLDSRNIYVDSEKDRPVQCSSQRLGASHSSHPAAHN